MLYCNQLVNSLVGLQVHSSLSISVSPLSLSFSFSLFVCLSVHPSSLSLIFSVCPPPPVSLHLSVVLSLCLSISLFLSPSPSLSLLVLSKFAFGWLYFLSNSFFLSIFHLSLSVWCLCSYDRCENLYVRIGHTHLTHSYLLNKEDVPLCSACGGPMTVKHFLIDCDSFNVVRRRFCQASSLKGLFGSVSPNLWLIF